MTFILSSSVGCGGADGLEKSITAESEAYATYLKIQLAHMPLTHTHLSIKPDIPSGHFILRKGNTEHLDYLDLLQNCIQQSCKHNEKCAYLHFHWYKHIWFSIHIKI